MSNTDKPFASAGCGCAQKKKKMPPLFCWPHFLIHHSQQRQFDTSFCCQPGPAGFLTHPEQKANPFTKYLVQIYVTIEWIAARKLSSKHNIKISSPDH